MLPSPTPPTRKPRKKIIASPPSTNTKTAHDWHIEPPHPRDGAGVRSCLGGVLKEYKSTFGQRSSLWAASGARTKDGITVASAKRMGYPKKKNQKLLLVFVVVSQACGIGRTHIGGEGHFNVGVRPPNQKRGRRTAKEGKKE